MNARGLQKCENVKKKRENLNKKVGPDTVFPTKVITLPEITV